MKFQDIKFKSTDHNNGIQALLDFGKYQMSIVQHDYSYGGSKGLYEIGMFEGKTMVEVPGVTEEGDTVKGFMSEDDIEEAIKKMESL
tara:strand:- start:6 stop:266 length:261 start_codon:yes stop_codon:yes gene_type:complete